MRISLVNESPDEHQNPPCPAQRAWEKGLDFFATGGAACGGGFALFFVVLAIDTVSYFFQLSNHTHQHGFAAISLNSSDQALATTFAGAFFLAALYVAKRPWSYSPVWAAPLAYVVAMVGFHYSSDQPHVADSTEEWVAVLLPIFTSALGAFLGGRLQAEARKANEGARPQPPKEGV